MWITVLLSDWADIEFRNISVLKIIAVKLQLDLDKVEKRDLSMFISELERSDKGQP
ncbi:hypothetical protein [Methanosarcina horonobensis]|uniref:hypothetical protein n=1 Tax=Methanosarcina horonobensis TaxID=418008 RepID=UPI000A780444|nr:hypothetical protein [Methanosarcina horonobensis]